jgi:RNA polymerase sigma factor (sigma-70 family)
LQRKLPEMEEAVEGRMMGAWLMRVTRYACLDAARRARRRSHYENKAAAMRSEMARTGDHEKAGEEVSPLIDEALDRLSRADRELVVLAYYQGRSHEEIAARLGIGREAAHKRVQRAVGRLRGILTKRGLPAAGMAGGLAVLGKPVAAPAAVAAAVMNAMGGQAPALVEAIAKGTMTMIKVMQVKTGVLMMAAAVVVLAGVTLMPAWGQTRGGGGGASAPVAGAVPAAADNGEFMPEVTLTLFETRTGHDFVADLDSGKTFTPPRTPPREAYRGLMGGWVWATDEGWDVCHENLLTSITDPGLIGFDLVAYPVADKVYDQTQTLGPRPWLSVFRATGATQNYMSAQTLPATYAFRTREGGVGVLQLVKSDRAASSLTLRYRLLSKSARDQAAEKYGVLVLTEMDRLAEILDTANDPRDVHAIVKGLSLEAASVRSAMKGTATRSAVWRNLESATHGMAEKAEDGHPEKVKEQLGDLKKALLSARDEMKPAQP